MYTRYRLLHLSIVDAPSRAVAYNIAKMQSSKIYVALLPVSNFFGMEVWNGNVEENFSMERKTFNMEWNGRKLPVWNMEKSSFIPFHTMPCLEVSECKKMQITRKILTN